MIAISGHEAIEFAGLAGELLLRNGAETSRVEDTINRICNRAGFHNTEVIVFPTGIIINGELDGVRLTRAKRIYARDINLHVVSIINDISRKYAAGRISLEEGLKTVRDLEQPTPSRTSFLGVLFAGALASGAATILLGGCGADFLPALMAAALVRVIIGITAFNLAYVLQIYVGGLVAGLLGGFLLTWVLVNTWAELWLVHCFRWFPGLP